jgi:hypothetical protein
MRTIAHARVGFTIVELLVVISIITVLMALILPAIMRVREAANRMICANNLRQIGIGLHNYHNDYHFFPPNMILGVGFPSWVVRVLPYLEQDAIKNAWDMNRTYYVQSDAAIKTEVKLLFCPSRRAPGELSKTGDGRFSYPHRPGALADYACCHGDLGPTTGPSWLHNSNGAMIAANRVEVFGVDPAWRLTNWRHRTRIQSITDGTTHTFLVGEKHVNREQYGLTDGGDNSAYSDDRFSFSRIAGVGFGIAVSPDAPFNHNFGSSHPRGICQFVMVDGSIRSLTPSTNEQTLHRLANRHDGEVVQNVDD